MSGPAITLDSEASIADACKLMGDRHIGSILLSHRGVIDAIFTERDLISKALNEKGNLTLAKLATYASSPLITVTPSTDVKEAARIMTAMKIRRLVVVQDGKPIGLFTAADLARAVGGFPLEL
jgi:CBS domain-containing protein